VAGNSAGEIIASQTVKFQFSILRDSESGTTVYKEPHSAPTNAFGLADTACFINKSSLRTAKGLVSEAIGSGGDNRTGISGYAENGSYNKGLEGYAL
jgi:hypothetical protein